MKLKSILFAVLAAAVSPGALAGSLQVNPVSVQLTAPTAAASLTLTNGESQPVNVQVRVFRWTQVDGSERLEPTNDVVASPPAITLSGGRATAVRIVRVTKQPPVREESYRVLIDQLPGAVRSGASLNLTVRHSIPVFVSLPDQAPPQLSWTVREANGKVEISAANSGGRRIRLSDLVIRTGAGDAALHHAGLIGYVLPGSSQSWSIGRARSPLSGKPVSVEAMSDVGLVKVGATVR